MTISGTWLSSTQRSEARQRRGRCPPFHLLLAHNSVCRRSSCSAALVVTGIDEALHRIGAQVEIADRRIPDAPPKSPASFDAHDADVGSSIWLRASGADRRPIAWSIRISVVADAALFTMAIRPLSGMPRSCQASPRHPSGVLHAAALIFTGYDHQVSAALPVDSTPDSERAKGTH